MSTEFHPEILPIGLDSSRWECRRMQDKRTEEATSPVRPERPSLVLRHGSFNKLPSRDDSYRSTASKTTSVLRLHTAVDSPVVIPEPFRSPSSPSSNYRFPSPNYDLFASPYRYDGIGDVSPWSGSSSETDWIGNGIAQVEGDAGIESEIDRLLSEMKGIISGDADEDSGVSEGEGPEYSREDAHDMTRLGVNELEGASTILLSPRDTRMTEEMYRYHMLQG